MSALLRIGRALARVGRHLLYADNAPCCCDECPVYWKALPCNNPTTPTCRPFKCEVYVCQSATCCDGTPIAPGSTIIYGGWCHVVQAGDIPVDQLPLDAVRIDPGQLCGPLAQCVPGGCDDPICKCPPGPWLYFTACPCPDGAGDGACRVISLADYGVVAASIGSSCVVAAFGSGGCQFVNFNSPRAQSLPPGCLVVGVGDLLGHATDTCCDCCAGCAFTRVTSDACEVIHTINPEWSCYPSTCCCQRVRFEWSLYAYFKPAATFQPFTVTFSGGATVDLVANPAGVVVPVIMTITPEGGTPYTETDSMALVCGTQNVLPAGLGDFYYGDHAPVQTGVFGPPGDQITLTQSGHYGCNRYSVTWHREWQRAFGTEIADMVWSITATPAGGSASTCSQGCTGATVVPAQGPCGQYAGDIGDGVPVGTGAFL